MSKLQSWPPHGVIFHYKYCLSYVLKLDVCDRRCWDPDEGYIGLHFKKNGLGMNLNVGLCLVYRNSIKEMQHMAL